LRRSHPSRPERRFAHAGFYAITPELFFREGLMFGKAQPQMARVSASIGRTQ
jgi:dienelactone hydrolase